MLLSWGNSDQKIRTYLPHIAHCDSVLRISDDDAYRTILAKIRRLCSLMLIIFLVKWYVDFAMRVVMTGIISRFRLISKANYVCNSFLISYMMRGNSSAKPCLHLHFNVPLRLRWNCFANPLDWVWRCAKVTYDLPVVDLIKNFTFELAILVFSDFWTYAK